MFFFKLFFGKILKTKVPNFGFHPNEKKIMNNILIKDIIRQLEDAENGDLWLDENFEKKLAQVSEEQAFVRPLPELHSVAELLSHLIVWRRVNVRRMQGENLDMPDSHPDNWKSNELLKTHYTWKSLKEDFHTSQQEVIALLSGKDDSYLDTVSTHYDKTYKYLLEGLIHHDMYHMGQLGITIKYLKLQSQS